ncbi:MAG TPA: Minf_1886 family protein [Gemmataceae bacterium]|nr:Minf_1886 family protein [Gemmataceae bacterium]
MLNPRIEELVRRDPRYAPEAYEFVFDALSYATRRLGRIRAEAARTETGGASDEHVSVADFLEGARELAVRDFGLMAPAVFRAWGVRRTDDFGDIVFNLIAAGLMDPTAADDRAAFHDRFDLQDGLMQDYRIEAGEEQENPS